MEAKKKDRTGKFKKKRKKYQINQPIEIQKPMRHFKRSWPKRVRQNTQNGVDRMLIVER